MPYIVTMVMPAATFSCNSLVNTAACLGIKRYWKSEKDNTLAKPPDCSFYGSVSIATLDAGALAIDSTNNILYFAQVSIANNMIRKIALC